jgi:uncharacterized membrane protein
MAPRHFQVDGNLKWGSLVVREGFTALAGGGAALLDVAGAVLSAGAFLSALLGMYLSVYFVVWPAFSLAGVT